MWRNILAVVVLLGLVGWGVYDYLNSNNSVKEEQRDIGIDIGYTAPDFTVNTLDGERVSLSDYRGKMVILNMWATWCGPCRVEMPEMQRFYEKFKYEGNGVEILAVNMTFRDDVQTIKEFVNEFGLTFPILLDEKNTVGSLYRVLNIPSTWFIDEEGVIREKHIGPMTEDMMKRVYFSMKK
jgi:peroxiredoxin